MCWLNSIQLECGVFKKCLKSRSIITHLVVTQGDPFRIDIYALTWFVRQAYPAIDYFIVRAKKSCLPGVISVQRYNPEQLEEILGEEFELIRHHKELHITPGGVEQIYLYCQFRKAV